MIVSANFIMGTTETSLWRQGIFFTIIRGACQEIKNLEMLLVERAGYSLFQSNQQKLQVKPVFVRLQKKRRNFSNRLHWISHILCTMQMQHYFQSLSDFVTINLVIS